MNKDEPIFLAMCFDRHIDPVVFPCLTLVGAIRKVNEFVKKNARFHKEIVQSWPNWCEYYVRYSSEGDRAYVKKSIIYE